MPEPAPWQRTQLQQVARKFGRPKQNGAGWKATCPACHQPEALRLGLGQGAITLTCLHCRANPDRLLGLAGIEADELVLREPPRVWRHILLRDAHTIETRRVDWLWEPRVPLGMLSGLVGDPGIGKSFILAALATAVSRGYPLPGGTPRPPGTVIMLAAEDADEYVTVPRLRELDADLTRIKLLDMRGGNVQFDRAALQELDERCADLRPTLVTIDPMMSFFGAQTDTSRDNEVRTVLGTLKAIAERHHCAILYVMHMNKATTQDVIYRTMGSMAFVAQARSLLLAGRDPDDKTQFALFHFKTNLGVLAEPVGYEIGDGGLRWLPATHLTVDSVLSRQHQDPEEKSRLQETVEALQAALIGGERPARDVMRELRDAGYAERTINRAKRVLGVRCPRRFTRDGKAYIAWHLHDGHHGHHGQIATPIDVGNVEPRATDEPDWWAQ